MCYNITKPREEDESEAKEEQERMKKMGVARSLAMALTIMAMCFAAGGSGQLEDNADGLRLPSQGDGVGGSDSKPWSCCDKCMCSRSIPPICTCRDTLVGGCHPKCKNCEQLPQAIYPPFFVCRDTIRDYCGDPCHPDSLLHK